MLAGSERQQGFFDAAWCAGLLAERSIYALLARHGDRIVRDEDFAGCYSERWGRPSIAPSLLAKVCCWRIATGCRIGGRWRRCGLICGGRWRWIYRSTIPASIT